MLLYASDKELTKTVPKGKAVRLAGTNCQNDKAYELRPFPVAVTPVPIIGNECSHVRKRAFPHGETVVSIWRNERSHGQKRAFPTGRKLQRIVYQPNEGRKLPWNLAFVRREKREVKLQIISQVIAPLLL